MTQTATLFDRNTDTRLNAIHALWPVCIVAYWLRLFHPRVADAVLRASARSWGGARAGLLLLLLLMGSAVGARPAHLGPWAMGVGGFTMMGAELVLLLGFQIVHGHLYYKLALLLAACMAGMALGGVVGLRPRRRLPLAHWPNCMRFGPAIYSLWLECFSSWPLARGNTARAASWLSCCSLWARCRGGMGVPAGHAPPLGRQPGGAARSAVYGADILGSCAGVAGELVGAAALCIRPRCWA